MPYRGSDGSTLSSFLDSSTEVVVTTFQGKWSNDDGAHWARRPGGLNGQRMKSSVSRACPTTALSALQCDTRRLYKHQPAGRAATFDK